ncbi:alpha-galactosidase [Thalassotalea euphylliae]|uniref:Alpha-galactosidase n=1 Tax=Thalassotalea euphylliae TaxID=1655234 RepID=A0A3E0TMK9_9GAMM|nr:alpha-galactosidase [Thalassotalea euphylliae]REL25633.1 alpha-galactosidase [Thalassotalea euphylliae]
MNNKPTHIHLAGQRSSLIINVSERTPRISYYGKKLSAQSSGQMIEMLATRQEAKCAVVNEPPIALTPTYGSGFTGHVGLEIGNNDDAWSFGGDISAVEQLNEHQVAITTTDEVRHLSLLHELRICPKTDVVECATSLFNNSDSELAVNWCAAPTFQVAASYTDIMAFEGRWSNEFRRQHIKRFLGSFVRENRKGKTSHDSFPGLIMHKTTTAEHQGDCIGFHLGWSGNHKVMSELLADGRGFVQMGELLLPSELTLAPGESYQSPKLYVCYSDTGFNTMSNSFHTFVREQLLSDKVLNKPRPVHYNTWEGIYFDHDTDTLVELAKQAADIGAERFVLDDGWFNGRRGDYAGLGDWFVDKEIYPEGLQPLIEQVLATGMAFGIWFEPEMINPDSDLYRNHPDWVLQTRGNPQIGFRNQYVLDLTNPAVCDYLFKCIDDILLEYPDISYIKWDMNRDVNQPGNGLGKPAIHQQMLALYALIDKLRAKHPNVEFESCCSGGGRVDYGILAHTDRVWTSDSNDALDRLEIQKGCSYFFPSNVMGAHVGPRDCHITGRRANIEMRAAVAMFGHMGIEMDPRELTEQERTSLKAAIALHKAHRELIHQGQLVRLDTDGNSVEFGIVNADKSEALFSYNSVIEPLRYMPNQFLFKGLDAQSKYKLDLVWPSQREDFKEYSESILDQALGQTFSGELLMEHGMQMPVLFPQNSLIFKLTKV